MKYCLGIYRLTIHLRSGLEDCAISVVCSSANRKKNPSLIFYNVQLACRKRTDSAASLGHLLLCTLASKAWAISSAGGGLRAVSIHGASGGLSSCWRPAGKGPEKFSGTAWGRGEGFFLFQRGDVNKCNAPTSPSPERASSKLRAQSIHLFSVAIHSQVVMAQAAAVQLRPYVNPSLSKGPTFLTHLLHFPLSSAALCCFGLGTFWG